MASQGLVGLSDWRDPNSLVMFIKNDLQLDPLKKDFSVSVTEHHVVRLQISQQGVHAQMHMFQPQEDLGDPGHRHSRGPILATAVEVSGP